MASKGKGKRNGSRKPLKLPDETVAEILAYAAKESVGSASVKYNVSERTIWRLKAAVTAGKMPQVAELISEVKSAAIERCKDLLTEANEVSLRRIIELVPSADIGQAIKAAEMCGQLKITRDVLNEPGGTNQPGDGA